VVVEVVVVDVVVDDPDFPVSASSRVDLVVADGGGIESPAGMNASVIISPFVMWIFVGLVTVLPVVEIGEAHTAATSVPLPFSGPVQVSPFFQVRWPLPG
jgi:hypothetical protein